MKTSERHTQNCSRDDFWDGINPLSFFGSRLKITPRFDKAALKGRDNTTHGNFASGAEAKHQIMQRSYHILHVFWILFYFIYFYAINLY